VVCVSFQSRLQRIARVGCSGRLPANLGRGRRPFATTLQRTAVDFGKLQVFAAHFGQDCRGLWQGKPLSFKGNRCSRLWKLTKDEAVGSVLVLIAIDSYLLIRAGKSAWPVMACHSGQPEAINAITRTAYFKTVWRRQLSTALTRSLPVLSPAHLSQKSIVPLSGS